jgi:ABC-type Fe3+/spermidine/putrescine transport system ATPase subunit
MRTELKIIQREVGITTIFVTHDQEEALAMSDEIVVMNHGIIEQKGSPEDVYRAPRSQFVASFLGQSNLIPATIRSVHDGAAEIVLPNGSTLSASVPPRLAEDAKVTVVVRAQRVGIEPLGATGENRLSGRIIATSYLGGSAIYLVDCGGLTLQANNIIEDRVHREGEEVLVAIAPSDCVLLDQSGLRIEA